MTKTRQTTTGRCRLCGDTFSRSGMGKHLRACRRKAGIEASVSDGPAQATTKAQPRVQSFHIIVGDRYDPRYWLHVDIPKKTKLQGLDAFLRNIWLECCGHLSAFSISGVRYNFDNTDYFGSLLGQQSNDMKAPLYRVLRPGETFRYEYDFGTTTELTLRVVSEGMMELQHGLRLLAKNEAPEIICSSCNSGPATQICTECIGCGGHDSIQGYLCDNCKTRHSCDEWMLLPVVNSPRSGSCGYTG